jgi:hypothetical protein
MPSIEYDDDDIFGTVNLSLAGPFLSDPLADE